MFSRHSRIVKNYIHVSIVMLEGLYESYQSGQHEIVVNHPWQIPNIPRNETQHHRDDRQDNQQDADGNNVRPSRVTQVCFKVRQLLGSQGRRKVARHGVGPQTGWFLEDGSIWFSVLKVRLGTHPGNDEWALIRL